MGAMTPRKADGGKRSLHHATLASARRVHDHLHCPSRHERQGHRPAVGRDRFPRKSARACVDEDTKHREEVNHEVSAQERQARSLRTGLAHRSHVRCVIRRRLLIDGAPPGRLFVADPRARAGSTAAGFSQMYQSTLRGVGNVRNRNSPVPDGGRDGLGPPARSTQHRPASRGRLATLAEFGEPGVGARELLDGPLADPEERGEFTNRSAATHGPPPRQRESPFYARRFAAAGVAPDKLDLDAMRAIPTTVKRDLIEQQQAFLCADVSPHLATQDHGTTGRAAEIWMSRYELELWAGMGALTGLLRGEIEPSDLMQVHVSSRATASVHLTAAICRLVGARCRVLGVVPVDQALDALVGEATLMSASPSYLGELVVAARRRGLDQCRLPAQTDRLRRRDPLSQPASGRRRDVRGTGQRRVRDDRSHSCVGSHLLAGTPSPRPEHWRC